MVVIVAQEYECIHYSELYVKIYYNGKFYINVFYHNNKK